jgi:Metallo-beta-lactamase superfamily
MSANAIADHDPAQAVRRACNVVAQALSQTRKRPEVISFFDEPTNTASHVVCDPASRRCAIVDSVLDYDAASGRTATDAADKIIAFVRDQGLEVQWILETHVHADHLSAAPYIKERLGGALGIGENIRVVQDIFGKVFNAGTEFQRDGSQFDHLFIDGERFTIGGLDAVALDTPGSHARLHNLRDRRRRLRRRHAVHAGLWHGPRRLSRRRCAHALSLRPPCPIAPRRDAPVPLPRLQGTRTGRVSVGNDRRRRARTQCPHA